MDPILAPLLLSPVALAYGNFVALRNRLFDSGILRAASMPVPVISVGNITVGGTGKTPLVAEIARMLSAQGLSVAILTRGYGGSASKGTLVLSGGKGGVAPGRLDPTIAGDEPILLAAQLPNVAIVVGADRRVTGRVAVLELGAQVLLLDDGFQHRWIRRDLDIVVLDCFDPFGMYLVLPAGRLREPLSGIARADLVVVTRSDPRDRLRTLEEVVRKWNPGAPIVRAFHRPIGWVPVLQAGKGETLPLSDLATVRAVGFCAIGNPAAFRSDLTHLGIELAAFESFRDHHRYSLEEIRGFSDRARAAGAQCLITTEKDAVRIVHALSGDASAESGLLPIHALAIRCELSPLETFKAAIEGVMARATETGA